MKKIVLAILVLSSSLMAMSQQPFSQKLDSVVGSDDFDRTRWKIEYTYPTLTDENGVAYYSDNSRIETHYLWHDNTWEPDTRTTYAVEDADEIVLTAKWNGETWENQSQTTYHYETVDDQSLLMNTVTATFADSTWMPAMRSTYQYDDRNLLLLNINYMHAEDEAEEWMADSKYEYSYDDEGALVTKLYSTIRNNQWRERSLDTLSYDEAHRCVEMLTRSKGGFGPGSNQWRDASKVEFSYEGDYLKSETTYQADWMGQEMTMNNKKEYQFDAQGNLVLKTASIFNGEDWIVRDQYINEVNPPMEATRILGVLPLWQSTVKRGMGFALNQDIPLVNQWTSCTIISTQLDTQFNLYYSGFATVDEHQPELLHAYGCEGKLVVENDEASDIMVVDLLGRVVIQKSHVIHEAFPLKPGLYFVSSKNSMVKTVVY